MASIRHNEWLTFPPHTATVCLFSWQYTRISTMKNDNKKTRKTDESNKSAGLGLGQLFHKKWKESLATLKKKVKSKKINESGRYSTHNLSQSLLKNWKAYLALLFIPVFISIIANVFIYMKDYFENLNVKAKINLEEYVAEMNIAEFSVYEFIFDLITSASVDKNGNIALHIFTGGLAGKGSTDEILYQGCIKIRYGVDLNNLTVNDFEITKDAIKIKLPNPSLVGDPEILKGGGCKSIILDTKSSSFFGMGKVDTLTQLKLQKSINAMYQKDSKHFIRNFNLEKLVKERTINVLRAFLTPLANKRAISITFHNSQKTSYLFNGEIPLKSGQT